MDEHRSGRIKGWIDEHLILQGNIAVGHTPKPTTQDSWIMLMLNTGRKILQYNEERLPLLITIMQEIIEKIGNQELRCKILNCLLSAKLNIVLKGLDGIFQIDGKTGKEVQCLLDELFTFDETFMAKLTILEQNATKQHICEMKKLILKDHVKVRQIYSDEGAKKACTAEFDDMVRGVAGEVNKSFLALVVEKLSGNSEAERHGCTASTSTISSPTLGTSSTGKKVESVRRSSQEARLTACDASFKRKRSSGKSTGKNVESGRCNSEEVGLAARDALSSRKLSSRNSSYLLRKNNSERTATSSRNVPRTRSFKDLDDGCRKKANCFIRKTEKLKIAEKRVELLYELCERRKKLDKAKAKRVIGRTKALGDRDVKLENTCRGKKRSGFVRSDCNSIGKYGVTASGYAISEAAKCKTEKCTIGNKERSGKSKTSCEIVEDRNEDSRILLSDELGFTKRTLRSRATFNRDQFPVEEKEHTGAFADIEATAECTNQQNWNKPLDSCTEQEKGCCQLLSSLGLTVDEYFSRGSDMPASCNAGRRRKEGKIRSSFCDRNKRSYASKELVDSTGRNRDAGIANLKRNDDKTGGICPVNDYIGDGATYNSVKLRDDRLGQRHHVVASGVEFSVRKAGLESTVKSPYNDTEASADLLEASATHPVVSSAPGIPVHCCPQQDGDIDQSSGNGLGNATKSLLSSIERAKRMTATESVSDRDALKKEEQCSCLRHELQLYAGCQHDESARVLSDLASKLLVLDGLLTDIKSSTAFDTSSEDSPSPVEEALCKTSLPETSFTDRFERLNSVSLSRTQCYPKQRHDSEGEFERRVDGMDLEEDNERCEPYDAISGKKSTDCTQNGCLDSEVANESGQLRKEIIDGLEPDHASEGTAFRDVFTISSTKAQNPGNVVDVFNEKRGTGRKEEKRVSVAAESKRDEAKKKILDFIDLTFCDSSDDNCCERDFDESDSLGQSLSQMDISEELSACSASPIEKKHHVSNWDAYVFDFDGISPEKEDRYDKFAKEQRFPACMNISSNCNFSLQLDESPASPFQ